jgi:hypothetical protein
VASCLAGAPVARPPPKAARPSALRRRFDVYAAAMANAGLAGVGPGAVLSEESGDEGAPEGPAPERLRPLLHAGEPMLDRCGACAALTPGPLPGPCGGSSPG